MKYYHGTDRKYDLLLLGPPSQIDVTKGGGEIGMGFYTTNDVWIAKSWAIARYGDNASVLELSFIDSQIKLLSMTSHIVKTVDELIGIWIGLKRTKSTRTFQFGKDIINAPFATIDSARQYKFESNNAETILNSISAKKIY